MNIKFVCTPIHIAVREGFGLIVGGPGGTHRPSRSILKTTATEIFTYFLSFYMVRQMRPRPTCYVTDLYCNLYNYSFVVSKRCYYASGKRDWYGNCNFVFILQLLKGCMHVW